MGDFEYSKKHQRKMELIVLILYGICTCGIITDITYNDWNGILSVLVVAAWVLCLVLFVGKYGTYHFRAFFTVTMADLALFIYSTHLNDLFPVLTIFIAITVIFGLYGLPKVMYVSAVMSTGLIAYHLFVIESITYESTEEMVSGLMQIVSVYLVESIMFTVLNIQQDIMNNQAETISIAREAENRKDDFMANVSHELRTPINTICGLSETLLQEELPANVREDVFAIRTSGMRLLSTVNDILDFSELQDGDLKLSEVAYNITSTINDVINMSQAEKKDKKIDLIVDCQADIPGGMFGDEQKLRRVIMNIVGNAIKFTDRGFVCIIIGYRETEYGINLCITVKDTGIGMKDTDVEKLFTTYNQVDTRRNRQEGGIGLGLAISRSIIDEMGGFIRIKSEFGKGSEVRFVIPQKVTDNNQIAVVEQPEDINAAIYLDVEKTGNSELWNEYALVFGHMMEQLKVKYCICKNFGELKHREKRKDFSHIFLFMDEYLANKDYFDGLSSNVRIAVILENSQRKEIENDRLSFIYKPVYVMSVARVLNNMETDSESQTLHQNYRQFIAPDVHVLAVDDNELNLRVLEKFLAPYQIEVTSVLSGAEALEKIESMDYDFVFMDHMMPEMDGVETLHQIRRKGGNYFKNIPIIALTANAIGGTREMLMKEGFNDYIAKPIELSVLERVLKRNIPKDKFVAASQMPPEPVQTKTENESSLLSGKVLPDAFDLEKGITYCGGMENYIEVLQIYCKNSGKNIEKLTGFLEQSDWKNYMILAHAIKGEAQNIGLDKLAKLAKALELAAKANEIAYIKENHDAMIQEYQTTVGLLYSSEIVPDAKADEALPEKGTDDTPAELLPPLGEEEFDRMLLELETAADNLDEDAMLRVIADLRTYSYHGHVFGDELNPIEYKIQMSDYLSALNAVRNLREKFQN